MDIFSHKVIIISKNLDGFSLANHGQFAKLSRYTFLLYVAGLACEVDSYYMVPIANVYYERFCCDCITT